MTLRPTYRIGGYGFLVVVGLTAALLTGRPEPAVLAAPFAIYLAVGLALGAPPSLDVGAVLDRDRVLEGDSVLLVITSGADVEVAPILSPDVEVVDEETRTDGRALRVCPRRWGVFDLGTTAARATDPLRLWWREGVLLSRAVVRVHPSTDRLRRAIAAAELQPFVGHHPSRARADGFEFAELRPYAIGDRAGAVNWRASARRGSLWVNDRHPDRSADVVLLLDTFGAEHDDRVALLDTAVHTLAALARLYEQTHDRVGLLTFGGHLRWLRPGGGRANLARIVDGMLDTDRLVTDSWDDVIRVPVGALPPKALLVAVTSLDSDISVVTLIDLRARGFDVAVLTTALPASTDPRADRLDALLRDARRKRLERFGVAVADLAYGVAPAIEEVNAWRRTAPRLHA